MQQKYGKLFFVTVKDFDGKLRAAIIDGTYSQIYGGKDIKAYSLFIIEGNKITNQCAWYDESKIKRAELQDKELAENMIEAYRLKE
jgi:hypothetical protein